MHYFILFYQQISLTTNFRMDKILFYLFYLENSDFLK